MIFRWTISWGSHLLLGTCPWHLGSWRCCSLAATQRVRSKEAAKFQSNWNSQSSLDQQIESHSCLRDLTFSSNPLCLGYHPQWHYLSQTLLGMNYLYLHLVCPGIATGHVDFLSCGLHFSRIAFYLRWNQSSERCHPAFQLLLSSRGCRLWSHRKVHLID